MVAVIMENVTEEASWTPNSMLRLLLQGSYGLTTAQQGLDLSVLLEAKCVHVMFSLLGRE